MFEQENVRKSRAVYNVERSAPYDSTYEHKPCEDGVDPTKSGDDRKWKK